MTVTITSETSCPLRYILTVLLQIPTHPCTHQNTQPKISDVSYRSNVFLWLKMVSILSHVAHERTHYHDLPTPTSTNTYNASSTYNDQTCSYMAHNVFLPVRCCTTLTYPTYDFLPYPYIDQYIECFDGTCNAQTCSYGS